jgi:hypothetical protein
MTMKSKRPGGDNSLAAPEAKRLKSSGRSTPPPAPAAHGSAASPSEDAAELKAEFATLLAEEGGGGGEKIHLSRLRQWDEIAFLIEEGTLEEDELAALWERVVGGAEDAVMDYAAFVRFNRDLEGMFEVEEYASDNDDMVVDQGGDAEDGAIGLARQIFASTLELAELRLKAAIKRSDDALKREEATEKVVELAERELCDAMAHLEMLRMTIKETLDNGRDH